jgi:hypothetical protein
MRQLWESQTRAKLITREREAESLRRYVALLKQSEIADYAEPVAQIHNHGSARAIRIQWRAAEYNVSAHVTVAAE